MNQDPPQPATVERAHRRNQRVPTLLVENATGLHIAVRVNGRRMGTATLGMNCMRIPQVTGQVLLDFVPVGSSAEQAWPVRLEDSLHWYVKVGPGGSLRQDLASLTPAEGSCREPRRAPPPTFVVL